MNHLINKLKAASITTRASLVYIVANIVSKSINIVTIPIFTRIMSTAEVGINTTYTSWYSIFFTVVTLSLCSGSLSVAFMDYEKQRDQYESACLTLSTISALGFGVVYFIFSGVFESITTLNSDLILLLIIGLIFNPALDFWYTRQRYEYKYKSTALVTICATVVPSLIAIFCVWKAKTNGGWNLGVVKTLSQGIVMSFIASIFYFYIMVKGKNYFDIEIWRYALKLSIPLIIQALAKSVLDMSDRLMISYICGKSEAGIYGTLYNFGLMGLLVWGAVNTAIIPTMFEQLRENKYCVIENMIQKLLLFFGVLSIVITLIAPEIVMILTTEEYYEAIYLLPALFGGIYMVALYNIYGNLLLYKKKTGNIMIATVITAMINILLNYVFIIKFGYIAAAYTTLASFIILSIIHGIMVRLAYKRQVVNDKKLIVISLTVSSICLGCNFLYPKTKLRYAIIVSFICIIFGWLKLKNLRGSKANRINDK